MDLVSANTVADIITRDWTKEVDVIIVQIEAEFWSHVSYNPER